MKKSSLVLESATLVCEFSNFVEGFLTWQGRRHLPLQLGYLSQRFSISTHFPSTVHVNSSSKQADSSRGITLSEQTSIK